MTPTNQQLASAFYSLFHGGKLSGIMSDCGLSNINEETMFFSSPVNAENLLSLLHRRTDRQFLYWHGKISEMDIELSSDSIDAAVLKIKNSIEWLPDVDLLNQSDKTKEKIYKLLTEIKK